MKIGLLGMGTIGTGVYEQVMQRTDMTIGRILDIRRIDEVASLLTTNYSDILSDSSIDTVVELMGGNEPAHTFALQALRAGKNFVSANKLMLARNLPELLQVARQNGVELRFSAAVGGGIPYLYNLLRAKRGDTILQVGGIVNGTTNFVLDCMQSEGADFHAALDTARKLGYAEANPAGDIDGLDAENKIALAATIAFDAYVSVDQVWTEGIGRLRSLDMEAFRSMGKVCRFLARAVNRSGAVFASVEPTLVDAGGLYAGVHRNFNLIGFTGCYAGDMNFMGQGAGKDPTAWSVVEDLVDVQKKNCILFDCGQKAAVEDKDPNPRRYYVRAGVDIPFRDQILFTQDGLTGCLTVPMKTPDLHRAMNDLRKADPDACFAALEE